MDTTNRVKTVRVKEYYSWIFAKVIIWLFFPLTSVVLGCSPFSFQAQYELDHPLVGTIVDVHSGREISWSEFLDRFHSVDLALLGEKHDHPDHHQIRADLLAQIGANRKKIVAVFEQIPPSYLPVLDGVTEDSLSELGTKLDWEFRGWPDFRIYEPLFKSLIRIKATFLAGGGEYGVEDQLSPELPALSLEAERILFEELYLSHCKKIERRKLPEFARSQRHRDYILQSELLKVPADLYVVIAGNGHVRNDFGIPTLLKYSAPRLRVRSVGFLEVDSARRTLKDYDRVSLPYDFVIFTPVESTEDPCLMFHNRE